MSEAPPGNLKQARSLLDELYEAGVAAVDPAEAVRRALALEGSTLRIGQRAFDLTSGRIIVVAIGKAALEMSHGIVEVLGDRIDAAIALTKDGVPAAHDRTGMNVAYASHPIPDARGVSATREILAMVSGLDTGDLVIALISGGGSALLEAPQAPLALKDIQVTTDALLKAGAPIQDLNAVRSELSRVKGGGLRRAIGEATCISLILSDVLGNDPSVIASGPTVPRRPNPQRALDLLDAYGLRASIPEAVVSLLEERCESAEPVGQEPSHPGDLWWIVGDNQRFIEAMAARADTLGHSARIVWRDREGEAADLGREFVDVCSAMPHDVGIVIGGGEATVTVRGDGTGGRNTEFALAAAIALHGKQAPWMIASLASDGDDGANVDAAGGFCDSALLSRLSRLSRRGDALADAEAALLRNDSGRYLREARSLFHSVPTGTNVNDAYIGIRMATE
jgi:glycerate 2-kinase